MRICPLHRENLPPAVSHKNLDRQIFSKYLQTLPGPL